MSIKDATLVGMTPPRSRSLRRFGPGLLVTAAFIGPGTVTKATSAGADFGHTLLWAVAFSVIATIIFQEMASRLGVVTGSGLGEAVHQTLENKFARWIAIVLVVTAIIVGNAAYQAGNIAGAAVGFTAAMGTGTQALVATTIGLIAMAVLMIGEFKWLQRILVACVVVMSTVFLLTAISVPVDWGAFFRSWVRPTIPSGAWTEVMALIGTTVVPYNLFLHATAAAQNWSDSRDEVQLNESLKQNRIDTIMSVSLGGLVTAAIVATATTAFFASDTKFENLSDAAVQLEPLLGKHSRLLFGIGLFAAGLTSAITAPLAAAYAAAGCFRWPADLKNWKLRAVFISVILFGTYFAASGSKPTDIITVAQVANGLLLPLLAVFLLVVMNNKKLLGNYRNRWLANALGAFTVVVVSALGFKSLYSLFGS